MMKLAHLRAAVRFDSGWWRRFAEFGCVHGPEWWKRGRPTCCAISNRCAARAGGAKSTAMRSRLRGVRACNDGGDDTLYERLVREQPGQWLLLDDVWPADLADSDT